LPKGNYSADEPIKCPLSRGNRQIAQENTADFWNRAGNWQGRYDKARTPAGPTVRRVPVDQRQSVWN